MHLFERTLSVSKEEIEFELRGITEISWSEFWLNPRRLRGSDFLMRWSQGVWSEKRLGGKSGLKKNAVLPTVIIKEEDRTPLLKWQEENRVPIHIWHVFFDRAYGLAFDEAERLIHEGLIEPTVQTFQAPGGASTRKIINKHYYHYAYPLGISKEQPLLIPDFIQDKNGHILPYVKFEGGSLEITPQALELLEGL